MMGIQLSLNGGQGVFFLLGRNSENTFKNLFLQSIRRREFKSLLENTRTTSLEQLG